MLTRRSSRSRGRRSFLRPLAGIFSALFVASCGPSGTNYLTEGIGSNLVTSEADIAQSSNLLNTYFNYLCQQAGLGGPSGAYTGRGCHLEPMGDKRWLLVVSQGMNDIDRRCDAYLQWLDNQKRSRGPIQSQIGSVRAATTGIMGVADASAAALTITGLAFDLLSKSIENYQSRLLLEVESSTVNTIVLNLRRKFRSDFRQERISVTDRPHAEYVLRSYLRLCLPFAIEANINNFSTLGSNGIAPTEDNSINWSPMSGLPIGAGDRPTRQGGSGQGGARIPNDDENRNVVAMYGTGSGKQLADLHEDQRRLCIAEIGGFGDKTWTAVAIYRRTQADAPDPTISGEGPFFNLSDGAQKAEYDRFRANPNTGNGCDTEQFVNVYEASRYATPAAVDAFVGKVNELNIDGVDLSAPKDSAGQSVFVANQNSAFRNSILALRNKLEGCGLTETLRDGQVHVTRNLDTALLKAKLDGSCIQ